jgi:hypothetical protein
MTFFRSMRSFFAPDAFLVKMPTLRILGQIPDLPFTVLILGADSCVDGGFLHDLVPQKPIAK